LDKIFVPAIQQPSATVRNRLQHLGDISVNGNRLKQSATSQQPKRQQNTGSGT
jgi:hypothetical protein